jgi:hypothetical protein
MLRYKNHSGNFFVQKTRLYIKKDRFMQGNDMIVVATHSRAAVFRYQGPEISRQISRMIALYCTHPHCSIEK